jgi:hypothetical protein
VSLVVGVACEKLVEGGYCTARVWRSGANGALSPEVADAALNAAEAAGWTRSPTGAHLCPRHADA